MVDARTSETALPMSSPVSPPAGAETDSSSTSQAKSPGEASAAAARLANAAAIDELRAREALAHLQRTRATARAETVKFKPPQPQPWLTPFITLAVTVGICTLLCTGGIAYLIVKPVAVAARSDAELRSLRETVTQLRRTVAALSNDVATNRAALDAANKAASDRFGRFAQNLEPVQSDQSAPVPKIGRVGDERTQVARAVPAVSSSEVTGTIERQPQPTNARREIIAGWRVRRASEGVAVLEGQPGVIEVALGQDVANLGRIQEIKYENNRWQVLTSKGVILSAR
jgi:hypothetical protein